MPGIYGYVKQNKLDNHLDKMTEKLYYFSHFLKNQEFNDDYIQASHIHLGKMKKNNKIFFKNGIFISIEGEQYDYKNISFEDLIYEAYFQDKL